MKTVEEIMLISYRKQRLETFFGFRFLLLVQHYVSWVAKCWKDERMKESTQKKSESSIYAARNSLSYAKCPPPHPPKCSLMYAHFWFHLLDFPCIAACTGKSTPRTHWIMVYFFSEHFAWISN